MGKKYLFNGLYDQRAYTLINQAGVKGVKPAEEGNETFNTCWDGAMAPDGTFYYTLSSEAGKCDHAKLVRYNYEKNAIEDCFYVGDLCQPQIRMLPHSKFHTSINFRPADNSCGYQVIGVTHNTDRAPHHPEWLPIPLYTDMWEGFPGSQIMVYDPETGHAESWGTPVPRETIYGAKYDPAHDRLYMIGFMRGHVYSMDCKTRRVKDLGKAAEMFNYRLAMAADGNIYSCTKSGEYYRINTEKDCLEDLHFQVPCYPGARSNNTHYRYLAAAHMDNAGKVLYCSNNCAWELFQYDLESGEMSVAGRLVPGDGYFPEEFPEVDYSVCAFCVDKYDVIWYEQNVHVSSYGDEVLDRWKGYHSRLFRWDIKNGKEPEYMGMVGLPGRVHGLTVEMEYDAVNDRIICVDNGRGFGAMGPCIVCIDLEEYRQHMYEPGPVCEEKDPWPGKVTPEDVQREKEARAKGAGEEVTAANPFIAFPLKDTYPVRLWNNVLRPEDSMVIGMAWDESGVLHVVTGESKVPGEPKMEEAKYVFRIRGRQLLGRMEWADMKDEYKAWFTGAMYPQAVTFDKASLAEGEHLPEVAGRRYRAYVTAEAEWHDGRRFVATRDAQCAMIGTDGVVFGLGNASSNGPVRCVCTNAAKDKLWGVSGDVEELGYVFSYDDKHGLRQLGILYYNSPDYYRPNASNILSSVCLSPDGRTLAIGGADRLGCVQIIDLHD